MEFNKPVTNITVMGVGTAGCKTIQIFPKENFENVKFICVDSDDIEINKPNNISKLLLKSKSSTLEKINNPLFGKIIVNDSYSKIKEAISDTKILILTSGFGGSVGTGALPSIAKIAKEMGILTIAIVTTPFSYEGTSKDAIAKNGLRELKEIADTTIVISNNRLINNYPDIAAIDAFKLINNILKNCTAAFIQLISENSTINLPYDELISSIKGKGEAYIGFGSGVGRNKIMRAINGALNSKIIEKSFMNASNVLMSIVADPTVTIQQINEIIEILKTKTKNNDLNIAFNFLTNDNLRNEIRISVIATFGNDNEKTKHDHYERMLHNSQELLIKIGNTLENELSSYTTGELELPQFEIEKTRLQFDDKDQDNIVITSEFDDEDDDIPFFLK